MNTLHLFRSVAVSTLAAVTLSACVVAPMYPMEPTVVVPQPPPRPYVEVVPAAPFAGAIWISGNWGWSRNRYEWVPGRYERPRTGHHWQPHRWREQQRGGWSQEGGRWVR